MNKFVLLTSMLFLHIVDDFYLQGILAKLKQRKFWEENAPQKLYKCDYIIALIIHAFSWCFMVHIPLLVWAFIKCVEYPAYMLMSTFICNTAIHAYVDDLKANKLKINLVTDQTIHFMQIILTFFIYMAI